MEETTEWLDMVTGNQCVLYPLPLTLCLEADGYMRDEGVDWAVQAR